ncbi:MAG: hypothetical protein JKY51_00415 [Opitutaceae bacterium]|nr:hypothetical protein [Opitutaceae bacterium]
MKTGFLVKPNSGGILKSAFLGILFIIAALMLGWMLFLPLLTTSHIKVHSGFGAEVESLSGNPLAGTITVLDLVLTNPEEFEEKDFVQLKEFDLKVKPLSLVGERIEVPRLVLDVEQITIVINEKGESNLKVFNERMQGEKSGEESVEEESEPVDFIINSLKIRVAKIRIADYSKGKEPIIREFNLDLNREFTDVSDPKVIVTAILMDITAAGLAQYGGDLFRMLPEGLSGSLGDALNPDGGFMKGVNEKSLNVLKNLFDSVREKDKK